MNDLLDELGWTRADLARRLGLHRNTPYRWDEPPEYVMVYLEFCVRVERAVRRLNREIDDAFEEGKVEKGDPGEHPQRDKSGKAP